MRIALLTNEFPPNIYGGAGIHVQFLSRELEKLCALQVRCFGTHAPSDTVQACQPRLPAPSQASWSKLLGPLDIDLQMAGSLPAVDLVHCHTWYTHFAGVVASRLQQIPLLLTTHSLEPHRPWKSEQLGQGGYDLSCWIERTAYQSAHGIIAVSSGMKKDVCNLYGVDPDRVQVIYNGIDPNFYKTTPDDGSLARLGIDPAKPFVLFVGRITRQKGIAELIAAIAQIDPAAQVVLCAGAPDTPEIAAEVREQILRVQAERSGIIWIQEMLDHAILRILYSSARVFVCPSLYEPFGIINLEAMSCGTPVVGSAVGGIPEIIVDGETGLLVPLKAKGPLDFSPADPLSFRTNLAQRINTLLSNADLAKRMGKAARQRVESIFGWSSIAKQTLEFYQISISRYQKENKVK